MSDRPLTPMDLLRTQLRRVSDAAGALQAEVRTLHELIKRLREHTHPYLGANNNCHPEGVSRTPVNKE